MTLLILTAIILSSSLVTCPGYIYYPDIAYDTTGKQKGSLKDLTKKYRGNLHVQKMRQLQKNTP